MTEVRPYGEWPSPITARVISEGTTSVGEVVPDGDCLWWSEHRPATGSTAIMHLCAGADEAFQATPAEANVRTRVHEYGGGAWWAEGGVCYYSDDTDGCLRKIVVNGGNGSDDGGEKSGAYENVEPVLLTQNEDGFADRWADMRLAPDGKWLVCVRERHRTGTSEAHAETSAADGGAGSGRGAELESGATLEGESQDSEEAAHLMPTNQIAAVATDGSGEIVTLVSGADFYAAPRPSPDGSRLAWLSWDLPDMPWDNTNLWAAELRDNEVSNPRCLAGRDSSVADSEHSEADEWVFQPEWHGDALTFVSDRGGWSSLWMAEFSPSGAAAPRRLVEYGDAEIQVPHWVFGQSRYAHAKTGLAWATTRAERDELHFGAGVAFSECSSVASVQAWRGGVVALAGRWDSSPEIVLLKKEGGSVAKEVIRPASGPHFDEKFFPPPEMISFATGSVVLTQQLSKEETEGSTTDFAADSSEGSSPDSQSSTKPDSKAEVNSAHEVAHALYFAPAHPEFAGPQDALPPLIVVAHGGPTGAARQELSWSRRYWTSRGFAVVDVDYRGSTGYGRKYRNALDGLWGVADVEDCIAAARHLCDRGDVDPQRLAIKGGSAGGYSVLCALAFYDIFAAGVSRYGIADLEALARDTHKFECRYLDRLVGPYPADRATYIERSPINHVEKLSCPMLILQGLQDKVVPPQQAEAMVDALKKRNLPYAYLTFPEEGHGFRNAASQIAAQEAELSFFGQIFDFTPADADDPEFHAAEVVGGGLAGEV